MTPAASRGGAAEGCPRGSQRVPEAAPPRLGQAPVPVASGSWMTAQQLPVGREPQQGPRSGLRGHLPDSQAGEGRTQSQPLQRSPSTSSRKDASSPGASWGASGGEAGGEGRRGARSALPHFDADQQAVPPRWRRSSPCGAAGGPRGKMSTGRAAITGRMTRSPRAGGLEPILKRVLGCLQRSERWVPQPRLLPASGRKPEPAGEA